MTSVLFDLDGTLTDPYVGITTSLCLAMERMGREVPDQSSMRWCIGPPIQEIIATLLGNDGAGEAACCLAYFRERFSTIGLFENEPYPGIPEALTELKEHGLLLFVATSKPTPFAVRILEHFDLSRHFQAIYGSGLDGMMTKKDEVIAELLSQERIAPSTAIMVGDRKHDVIGAHLNRMPCLGVLYGYGDRQELELAGADAICPSPNELVGSIEELFQPKE